MNINEILRTSFICLNEDIGDRYNRKSAPLFRKDFTLKKFKSAKLYICGLGFYELFINGKNITKGKLAPYISNPNDIIYYDEYDLTNILNNGDNALSVLLGTGWLNPIGGDVWGFTKADWIQSERLSLVLIVDEEIFLISDESFKAKPSHIIFNSLRCGEYHDNRLYNENDYLFGNIDDTFVKVNKTTSPKGELKLCKAEPIGIIKKVLPQSVKKVDDGYIYDFGENLAGIPSFKIKGHPGQLIQLWHGECLVDGVFYNKNTCTPDADRYLSQKDILICSGNLDYFEPYFTYHGFRYIYIEGSEGIPCELEMLVLSSKLENRGHFECSNKIINDIQKLTLNSDISNFFYFPTDCPQREKNGWTGDAQLSCEQLMYNYDCSNSLSIWLENIRKSQKDNGVIPGLVPTYKFGYDWGNGPNWDMAIFELPYQIYKFNGDKQIILDNKEMMFNYLFLNLKNRLNEDGLINYGLCDWCEAGSILEYVCTTPVEVTDSLCSIDMLYKAEILFKSINEIEKANFCKDFYNLLIKNFRKKYVKDCFVSSSTQTSQAFAIKVGIFSDDEKEVAIKKLVDLIHSNNDLMKYGVTGNKIIYDVLTENGYGDLAIKLICQDKFPSFKYWLDIGATSLWEAFNEVETNNVIRKDGGRVLSLNHHFWGTVSAFFYKYIAGININPSLKNANEISIKPYLFKDIDYVKCDYANNNNKIIFEVKKIKNELKVNIIENKGFIIK